MNNQTEDSAGSRSPIVINGAQDFKEGKAYVAITLKQQQGYEFEEKVLLIDSDKNKTEFLANILYQKDIIAERKPLPESFRWGIAGLDDFLETGNVVTLENIHEGIVSQSKKYLHFANPVLHEFIATWIIGTYFHRMFPSYPYIHLNGNAHSGKTKCLTLIASLAFNAEMSFNNTAAYMVRLIHDNSATCCMDEVESLRRAKDEDSKALLAMLNSGYKRGSFSGKMEPKKPNGWVRVRLESYSPKVLAGIDTLPATLSTRCIPIIMARSINKEVVNSEINQLDSVWSKIRNNLYRSLLTHHHLVEETYAELTDLEIAGRPWELWKPILAIAKCINQETYERIRILALEIESNKKEIESEQILTPILLQGLYELMMGRIEPECFYSLITVCEFLSTYDAEAFGWLSEDKHKNRRGRWLVNQLRIAGLVTGKAEQKKVNGINNKGFTFNREKIVELLSAFGITVKETPQASVEEKSIEEMVKEIPY